ncbi:hypothetical protein [Mycobacterium sp. E796]|uniref:hypothetical protein n=1 Tax=Mycobacterium sp. E796 TaxID=1834151 RepID=UPI000800D46A|nr:hypothetical protein [Mycobacterium sp. E796]OBI41463.1 hypothetical protein A5706_00745 [Mycobacterium sp. E796]
MSSIARPATLGISTVFGALMVGLAAFGSHGPAVVAGVAAAVAVGASVVFRPAATLAVLLTVAIILASDPSLVFAAWSGLCAVAYLVCRHAVGAPVMWSWPTAVAAVGFMFAGLVASAFPLQLPWLPLAAPVGVLAIYVLATRPFVS